MRVLVYLEFQMWIYWTSFFSNVQQKDPWVAENEDWGVRAKPARTWTLAGGVLCVS